MAVWLKTADPDFEDRFTSLLAANLLYELLCLF